MGTLFQRNSHTQDIELTPSDSPAKLAAVNPTHEKQTVLPTYQVNHNGHRVTKHIAPEGESGRKWLHPLHFFKICWRSTSDASRAVNLLWPVVPAAIALRYARKDLHLAIFILNYIAMVPCANLIGFAGQELSRKLPKVFGILIETTLGSVVEIVLFIVLLNQDQFAVIQAAILGSILATLLLCLGLCFVAGGIRHPEQEFDEVVSEVGNGLLLTAGLGLTVPTAFYFAVDGTGLATAAELNDKVTSLSRVASIFLIIAYLIFVWFQAHSHHSIFDAILEGDEQKDRDRQVDLVKPKLTFTECILALTGSIALVTLISIGLVQEIPSIVESHNVSDAFMGLILVPVVEKAAEHLTAVDEAWDDQMNFALSHVLGATIQTALLNAPLVVIVGWGVGKPMGLHFAMFDIIVLILAILVVGNFLRDQKSNYLEGALCIIVYIIIAAGAFYYPNPNSETTAAIA